MYKIVITPRAKKGLVGIRKVGQRRVVSQIIEEMKNDPYIGKPLGRDLRGKYSYRVGVGRIIYMIDEGNKKVSILVVGHRSKIYD